MVRRAVAAGARLVTGGARSIRASLHAALLAGVTRPAEIAQDEVFGRCSR